MQQIEGSKERGARGRLGSRIVRVYPKRANQPDAVTPRFFNDRFRRKSSSSLSNAPEAPRESRRSDKFHVRSASWSASPAASSAMRLVPR
jgi:hypothetical protein